VNAGFCDKVEVTRLPPGRPSRTTSGTRTTGWEPLLYNVGENSFYYVTKQLICYSKILNLSALTKKFSRNASSRVYGLVPKSVVPKRIRAVTQIKVPNMSYY